LPVVLEGADAQFDDLVAIGIGPRGFDIHDSGDELRRAIRWVVFGLRFQPTSNPIIAALDERSSHLFERRFHVPDIENTRAVCNRYGLKGFEACNRSHPKICPLLRKHKPELRDGEEKQSVTVTNHPLWPLQKQPIGAAAAKLSLNPFSVEDLALMQHIREVMPEVRSGERALA